MNLQKLLMLALLAAAVSATTMPTLGKVLGFNQTASAAVCTNQEADADDDWQGDQDCQ